MLWAVVCCLPAGGRREGKMADAVHHIKPRDHTYTGEPHLLALLSLARERIMSYILW